MSPKLHGYGGLTSGEVKAIARTQAAWGGNRTHRHYLEAEVRVDDAYATR
jgi:hypothetical protein